MRKSIVSGFALMMLLVGSTAMPAEARWGGGFGGGGFHRGFGGGGYHSGLGLGLGLAGVGVGLGLGSAYYNGYAAPPAYGYYNPYNSGGYNLYSAPPGYYGYYGSNGWY